MVTLLLVARTADTMLTNNRNSLIHAVRLVLTALLLVALVAMVSAIAILLGSHSDARAINVSGSLRMQSYRLAHAVAIDAPAATLASYVTQFELSLADPSLLPYLGTADHPSSHQAATIFHNWQQTQAQLAATASRYDIHNNIAAMVADIDQLVATIQHDLEQKVRDLLLIQGGCLTLLLALSIWALVRVQRRLIAPLRQLDQAARAVEQGQFALQLPTTSDDELGTLSTTFGRMASELERLYDNLEAEVSAKTAALQHALDTLALLYRSAEQIHGAVLDEQLVTTVLEEVRQATGLCRLCLLLEEELSGLPSQLETRQPQPPEVVLSHHCWPLTVDNQRLGELRAHGPSALTNSNRELLASIANLLARRVHVETLLRSEQQRLVQEERAIIARELHDSLAQTLSTIRFQLTVARHHLDHSPELVADQLEQIQTITANAYRHLRELLVTFRLTISATSLETAIRTMVDELGGQITPKVLLDYRPQRVNLAPPRFIHVLQIIREAVVNAAKHAQADQIRVTVTGGGEQPLTLAVCDNGCGINPEIAAARQGHFGLDIMRERARSLGGELTIIAAQANAGTCVTLTLPLAPEPQR